MAISSDAVRRNSVVLLAYASELRQNATDARQQSAECRKMAQKARILADVRRARAKDARKRQDARSWQPSVSPCPRDPIVLAIGRGGTHPLLQTA